MNSTLFTHAYIALFFNIAGNIPVNLFDNWTHNINIPFHGSDFLDELSYLWHRAGPFLALWIFLHLELPPS